MEGSGCVGTARKEAAGGCGRGRIGERAAVGIGAGLPVGIGSEPMDGVRADAIGAEEAIGAAGISVGMGWGWGLGLMKVTLGRVGAGSEGVGRLWITRKAACVRAEEL